MKILICAIGKAKNTSPHQLLFLEYIKRLPWKIDVREFAASDKSKEAKQLLSALVGYEYIISLDETGELLSSREFSEKLGGLQQKGTSSFAFVIGGADGLDESVVRKSNLCWSFGRVTWPHMLVRGMLAEQIYRAYSVLNHHPYHRE